MSGWLRQFVGQNKKEIALLLFGLLFGMAISAAFAFGFAWGKEGFLSSTAATWAQALITTATIGTAVYVGHLQVSESRSLAEADRESTRGMAEDDRKHQKQLAADERRGTLDGYNALASTITSVMANSAALLPTGPDSLDGTAARASRFLNPMKAGLSALQPVPVHEIPYAYVASQGMNLKIAAGMYVDWLTEISTLPDVGAAWSEDVQTAIKTLRDLAAAAESWTQEMSVLAASYDGHGPPVVKTVESEP